MTLIDTHCHLDVEAFDTDRDAVLSRCRDNGIEQIIVPGITAHGWDKLIQTCTAHDGLHYALGLHPVYTAQHEEADLQRLQERVAKQRPLAIGEIGLDFYIDKPDKERQIHFFEAQLVIARDHDLPVIVHVRKAHDQVLKSLKRIGVRGGTSHAFNGSLQQADQYIELGFKLGFGGMLTFERSNKLRRLARELPLSSLVLETDAPDMTVASHRGERNSPEYLPEVLTSLAEVRGMDIDETAAATTHNARELFGLP
ncbi:MAG: TatD family hydrolase [Gammaproteobacteria bacterium]|nr:TatD family hydrolase [Gammaproteobacteria bacterium]